MSLCVLQTNAQGMPTQTLKGILCLGKTQWAHDKVSWDENMLNLTPS